ncbi:IclR family transcriptional regulator [Microbacterium sp. LWS13-1.2]|uniref:IclR family transcriptional regulator n=1 Tax=Microbacterium sp. LWS13-1.2 TaxID=3135264 RepID=A0AAU6SE99_9MICO
MSPLANGAPVGSLARGIAALEVLAARETASVAEIGDALQLTRSTAYRLMHTLEEWGWVEGAGVPGRLRLGIKAAEIGAAANATVDVTRVVRDHLRELVEATQETAFFAVYDEDAMVYMHSEQGVHTIQLSARMGSRRPLHATGLGKAFLSALSPQEYERIASSLEITRLTSNTIGDRASLDLDVESARSRGYSIDREEGEIGVSCVAAPIIGRTGAPLGALSVAGPTDRVGPRTDEYGAVVSALAGQISRRLGAADRASSPSRIAIGSPAPIPDPENHPARPTGPS